MTLAADLSSPIFWAVFIGWSLTVVIHELAHGIVGYLGGDYTIKERGGLTLNPIQYVDPFGSIILPAIFLLMGGVPLPGGVTYVDRSLLRNRVWASAMSLAGPASNFVLFLLFALPMHPSIGWIPQPDWGEQQTPVQMFFGAMVTLQFFATIFNLFPIPPLDGYQFVMPWLGKGAEALARPPLSYVGFGIFFGLLVVAGRNADLASRMFRPCSKMLEVIGYDDQSINVVRVGYNSVLVGKSD